MAAGTPTVLLLEFNELSPLLMERFVGGGLLPNFKILHDVSEIYTTEAVEKYRYLEPWIQWITVHCVSTMTSTVSTGSGTACISRNPASGMSCRISSFGCGSAAA